MTELWAQTQKVMWTVHIIEKTVPEGKTHFAKHVFNANDFEMGCTLSQHHIERRGRPKLGDKTCKVLLLNLET